MDKQIEEMAKTMCGGCIENELMTCSFTHEEVPCCFAKQFAESLYSAGYRKIPEGAVVLTREEYSDYLVMKDAHQNAIERCEKLQADNERLYKNIGKFKDAVRKETAEKFAERLKETLCHIPQHHFNLLEVERCIDEICKKLEGDNG